MTPEQMRIAIAEECGWRCCKADYNIALKLHKFPPTSLVGVAPWAGAHIDGSEDYHFHLLPNYPNNLNAMHEAEKVLTQQQRFIFYTYLMACCNTSEIKNLIHATAPQRAEAFLRTVGKWKGGDV